MEQFQRRARSQQFGALSRFRINFLSQFREAFGDCRCSRVARQAGLDVVERLEGGLRLRGNFS